MEVTKIESENRLSTCSRVMPSPLSRTVKYKSSPSFHTLSVISPSPSMNSIPW